MVRQPLRSLPFTSGFLNIFGIVWFPQVISKCAQAIKMKKTMKKL